MFRDVFAVVVFPSPRLALLLHVANLTILRIELLLHHVAEDPTSSRISHEIMRLLSLALPGISTVSGKVRELHERDDNVE